MKHADRSVKKIFSSKKRFRNTFTSTLAIFCSDERFNGTSIEFLQTFLKIRRCDLIVYPGGPQFIVNNEKGPVKRMKFLIQAHKISRVLLISHTSCGYYQNLYPDMTDRMLMKLQIADIHKSIKRLHRMFPDISVLSFYMDLDHTRFMCTPV